MATTIDLSDAIAESPDMAPAPITPSASALAVAQSDLEALGIYGNVTTDDLTIPYLGIVQKSGTKADTFTPGSWIVGENKIAEKDSSVRVVALSIKKAYQEVTEFGSGIMPRTFDTPEEVRAAGLSLTRGAASAATEIAYIVFWVAAPEGGDPDLFPIVTSSGARGTVAKFVARSTSYGGVAMPIFTAVSPLGHLRGKPLKAGQWDLSAALTKANGNTFYKLSLRPKGATPEDVIQTINTLGL